MGYTGSMILQVICFVFVLKPDLFGITVGKASQISFLLVGIWWWGFAQFSLRRLPKGTPAIIDPTRNILSGGYKELQKVWSQLKHLPVLKRFLGSYFFYNMGVQTIMIVATLYGKSELGLPTTKPDYCYSYYTINSNTRCLYNLVFELENWKPAGINDGCGFVDHIVLWRLPFASWRCQCILCTCRFCWFCNGWNTIPKPKHLFQTNACNKRHYFVL